MALINSSDRYRGSWVSSDPQAQTGTSDQGLEFLLDPFTGSP